MDKLSGTRFLVDTGAEVSVLPPTKADRQRKPSGQTLRAANSTSIQTYGLKSLTIDIGLRRTFRWVFVIADVVHPLLGSDFLAYFDLDVSMRRHALVDSTTRLSVTGVQSALVSMEIRTLLPSSKFEDILREFPEVTKPCNLKLPPQHGVTHHIVTTGPPVSARPRRLIGERLAIAKREFEHMLDLGIVRPSSVGTPRPYTWFPRRTPGTGGRVGTTAP